MKNRATIPGLMTAALMLETVSAQDPAPPSEWLARTWQTEDGLPQKRLSRKYAG